MTESANTPWHILGAGAIGSLWASYLLRREHPVTLLCRTPEQLDSWWDNPFLTLVKDGQRFKYQPATESTRLKTPISKLLITTKSYDTEAAVETVAPRITSETRILILQNGMGAQQTVAERFPDAAVYAAVTTEGAYRTGPQQVVHAGTGLSWLGPMNDNARQAGAAPLQALLNLELKSRYEEDIATRLWQKLAINSAINGLTALHDCENGQLLENADYYAEMTRLCEEAEQVAAALQQPLFDHPLIEAAAGVARATAGNLSSMLQDVRHQRPTEIDFINGYICRMADKLTIEVPENQRVLTAIEALRNR